MRCLGSKLRPSLSWEAACMASLTLKCGCNRSSCMMYLEIRRKIRISLGLPFTHTEPVALVDLEIQVQIFVTYFYFHIYFFLYAVLKLFSHWNWKSSESALLHQCFAASAESFRLSRDFSLTVKKSHSHIGITANLQLEIITPAHRSWCILRAGICTAHIL